MVQVCDIVRRFGEQVALSGVSLAVEAGEIHALLGPNGAGKTTLIRTLTGLLTPTSGSVHVLGEETSRSPRTLRRQMGLVPAGDRSFYLRISGLENLIFFARLHGMRRRPAALRAREVLGQVGLTEAARVRVGVYSHGMQKRLSVARALLTDPVVLLVDEASHDLDPEGARRIRELVQDAAGRGAAVVWATQRIEEIRGFADRVTLLSRGEVRFVGTVPELIAHSVPRRYLVRLRNGSETGERLDADLEGLLAGLATLQPAGESSSESYVLSLADGAVLGDALARLTAVRINVLGCTEERPEIEDAFLLLAGATQDDGS